jgi:hypothetical protein
MDGKNKNAPGEATMVDDFFQLAKQKVTSSLPLPGCTYESLFWRPYLGGVAFALWQVIRDYQREARPPGDATGAQSACTATISAIEKTLGIGDRYTILGRRATATRPAQRGEIERLKEEGLLSYRIIGGGRGRRYRLIVLEDLPLLTPAQVDRLPSILRGRHRRWIGRLGVANEWLAASSPTLLRPQGKLFQAVSHPGEVSTRRVAGYIYIIEAANGLYKIGQSKKPKRRFQTLEMASPVRLHLLKKFEVDNMLAAEFALHERFEERRIKGEWFRLKSEDLKLILRLGWFEDGAWVFAN